VQVWFDPKSTPNLIDDLSSDDLPIIHTKVGGSLIDFEGFVDYETTFSHYYPNAIRGKAGEQAIGPTDDLIMLWEVGNSHIIEEEAKHCTFNNSECYILKILPVVD